jgi:hypothetical protein
MNGDPCNQRAWAIRTEGVSPQNLHVNQHDLTMKLYLHIVIASRPGEIQAGLHLSAKP